MKCEILWTNNGMDGWGLERLVNTDGMDSWGLDVLEKNGRADGWGCELLAKLMELMVVGYKLLESNNGMDRESL